MTMFWKKVQEKLKGVPVTGEERIMSLVEEKMLKLEGENLCIDYDYLHEKINELKNSEIFEFNIHPIHVYIDIEKKKMILESFIDSKLKKEIPLESCELRKL